MVPVKYGAQGYNYDSDNEIIILIILKLNIGYASNFILSVFDRYWREVMLIIIISIYHNNNNNNNIIIIITFRAYH